MYAYWQLTISAATHLLHGATDCHWGLPTCVHTYTLTYIYTIRVRTYVHSCQQKSIGLKFSKSQTGSYMRYSCHHNSSRFTFPIFAHSCRFSVFHSLQSIIPRIYINRRRQYIRKFQADGFLLTRVYIHTYIHYTHWYIHYTHWYININIYIHTYIHTYIHRCLFMWAGKYQHVRQTE